VCADARACLHSPFNYVRALANEQRRRKQWRKPVEAGVGVGWRLANDATLRLASVASVAGGKLRRLRALPEALAGEAEAEPDADADEVDVFSV
jgi:hypothetical protein